MKNHYHHFILENHDPQTVIDTIEPFLLEPRLGRIQSVLDQRLESIHLVFESPADVHNAVAALRSAEIFGVVNIHIIAPESELLYAKTISQSAIFWVNLHFYNSLDAFFTQIPRTNSCFAGAKMDGEIALSELSVEQPLYLFFGNEHRGLSKDALKHCNTTFHIPMQGMTESLNLSVSASISLYDTTRRKRALLAGKCDLSEKTYRELQARYYLNSTSKRLLPKLFPNN